VRPPPLGAIPPRPDRLESVGEPWPGVAWDLRELVPVFLMPFGLSLYMVTVLGGVLRLRGEGVQLLATLLQQLIFLTPLIWARWVGHPAASAFVWRMPPVGDLARGVGVGLLAVFASGAVMLATLEFARAVLGRTPDVTNALDPFHGPWEVIGAIVAVVVAPVCEEFLFRGVLFVGLRGRWSFWPAAALSALAFALVHGDPIRLPALVVVGMLLAGLVERTHKLGASMAAHLTLNLISVLFLFAGR
jgi:CAAX protease family protein